MGRNEVRRVLRERPQSTAREVAEALGIGMDRVTGVIYRMTDVVRDDRRRPMRFSLAPPASASGTRSETVGQALAPASALDSIIKAALADAEARLERARSQLESAERAFRAATADAERYRAIAELLKPS